MKFKISAIDAKPGEDLKVVLTNIGTQPMEVMGHNWVPLKSGSDVDVFVAAAISAKDSGYLPPALADEVIAHIDILGPRKSGEADFKAPMIPAKKSKMMGRICCGFRPLGVDPGRLRARVRPPKRG